VCQQTERSARRTLASVLGDVAGTGEIVADDADLHSSSSTVLMVAAFMITCPLTPEQRRQLIQMLTHGLFGAVGIPRDDPS